MSLPSMFIDPLQGRCFLVPEDDYTHLINTLKEAKFIIDCFAESHDYSAENMIKNCKSTINKALENVK